MSNKEGLDQVGNDIVQYVQKADDSDGKMIWCNNQNTFKLLKKKHNLTISSSCLKKHIMRM